MLLVYIRRQHLRALITTFPALCKLNTQQIFLVHIQIVRFLSACCGVRFATRLLYITVIMLTGHCVTHNTYNLAVNLLGDAIMGGFSGGGGSYLVVCNIFLPFSKLQNINYCLQ